MMTRRRERPCPSTRSAAACARGAWLAAACLALASCAVALQPGRPARAARGALVVSEARAAACPRSPGGAGATYREELPGAVTDPARQAALAALSPAARRTALAAGLEPLLGEVLLAWPRAGGLPSLEAIALRQQLDAALAALPPQLLAVEFEAECTISLMADALDERAGDRERRALRLTVASLVAGAATGLAAGLWDLAGTESDGPVLLGLAGAAATTALGVATLVTPARPVVFVHEHNLLAPIVRGEDPDRLYPTFVFRLLTLPTPTGAAPPGARLRDAWQAQLAEAVPAGQRARAAALLFEAGGVYDDDVLALRRRLFEELEATLDSFARDIDLLTTTVARALGPPPVAPAR